MTHIVILANHQHAGLAAALRALLPAARVENFDIATLGRDSEEQRQAAAAAQQADHIISQDIPPGFGALSTGALRAARRPLHLLPVFRFAGFHPDSVAITLDGTAVAGPTGALHSRIAVAAFLAGLPVPDAAALFNSLVFARLGYYAAFAAERARLLQGFSIYGWDLAPFIDAWLQPGCFMFDPTRPRMRVLLDLARLLCARMALTHAADITEAQVQNPLATAPMQPLFPDIAARIGVSPEGGFRGPTPPGGRPNLFNLDTFLTDSFDAYRRLPLAVLRGAAGIETALPALYLHEADFGRAAATARAAAAPGDDLLFLTWHGKVLSIETATATLIQVPPWRTQTDSTPAAVTAVDLAAPAEIPLAGGMQSAPAGRGACITLAQQGRHLIAPRTFLTLRFAADPPPSTDLFLPIRRADLAALGKLDGATLRPDFMLTVGAHRIDLATARIASAPGDPPRLMVATPDGTITLASGATATPPAIAADSEALPIAASIEQFRATPGHRLHVHGAAEMFHLPLTVDSQARAWLVEKHHRGAPRLGRVSVRLSVARAADKFVRLDRGAEGVIFDAEGVWARAGRRTLAPGVHALDAAPRLDGPLCVFFNPNLRDPYHWLAEAALTLHVLLPILPPGTRLLLPASLPDASALFATVGLPALPCVVAAAPLVRAADVLWLEQDHIATIPAALVQSFRARAHALHPPAGARRKIFLKPAAGRLIAKPAALENFLHARGFETISLADAATPQAIALFAAADFIVAPRQPALAGLLFCRPGTRVLELAPDDAFRPNFWQMSEKLGLLHAVLPCETIDATSESDLIVAIERFRALFRMLRLSAP